MKLLIGEGDWKMKISISNHLILNANHLPDNQGQQFAYYPFLFIIFGSIYFEGDVPKMIFYFLVLLEQADMVRIGNVKKFPLSPQTFPTFNIAWNKK